MNTHGFTAFEREFYSTGRDKIDGYTFSNFDAMTPTEKSKAVDMLAGELPSFFPAADALAYLDADRCEAEIRKTLSAKTPVERGRAFHLYFVLWQITGEEAPIDHLLEIGRNDLVDATALLSDIAQVPSYPKVLEFLYDLVMQHPSERAVEQAASQLIDRYDVLEEGEICNADSIALMRDLTSQLHAEKKIGIAKLKTQFNIKVA